MGCGSNQLADMTHSCRFGPLMEAQEKGISSHEKDVSVPDTFGQDCRLRSASEVDRSASR